MSNSEQKPNKLSRDLSWGDDNAVKLRVCMLRMFGIWLCLQALGVEPKVTSQNQVPLFLRHTYTRLQHMNKGDNRVMCYVTLDNSAGTKTPAIHI